MLEIENNFRLFEKLKQRGQLNYIQNQVSFSTITVEFYKSNAEESGVTVSMDENLDCYQIRIQ
jgi:hypothetical protein